MAIGFGKGGEWEGSVDAHGEVRKRLMWLDSQGLIGLRNIF